MQCILLLLPSPTYCHLFFFVPAFLIPFKCQSPSATRHFSICSSDEVFCWLRTFTFYSTCWSASSLWSLKGTRRDLQWHREDQLILSFVSLFGSNVVVFRFSFFTFFALLYLLPFCFMSLCSYFVHHISSPELGSIILVCTSRNLLHSTICLIELAVQSRLTGLWNASGAIRQVTKNAIPCHESCPRDISHFHLHWWEKYIFWSEYLLNTRVFFCFIWE